MPSWGTEAGVGADWPTILCTSSKAGYFNKTRSEYELNTNNRGSPFWCPKDIRGLDNPMQKKGVSYQANKLIMPAWTSSGTAECSGCNDGTLGSIQNPAGAGILYCSWFPGGAVDGYVTTMQSDYLGGKFQFLHNGGMNVLFLDGHVGRITRVQMDACNASGGDFTLWIGRQKL